jgi:hypothetical protein
MVLFINNLIGGMKESVSLEDMDVDERIGASDGLIQIWLRALVFRTGQKMPYAAHSTRILGSQL